MSEEILKKFLSNQCSYKECESIVHYYEEHEEELDKIEIFESIPEREIIKTSALEKEHLLNSILPLKSPTRGLKQLLIAAIILIAAAFPFYKVGVHDQINSIESLTRISLFNNGISSKWFVLPDSSRVKLEPEAKITYRSNFENNRELHQIEGEVTYYVQPNKDRPFRVIKQGVQTKALGTIFTIADYNDDKLMVKLLEGKIVVEDHNQLIKTQIYVTDQATVIINKDDFTYQLIEEKKTDFTKAWETEKKNSKTNYPSSSIAWSNQVVNFNGVSNSDLFSIMERLYSLTIDVESPQIMNGNFTGALKQNDNIENLLTIFCQINGCEFSIQDAIIKIK